MSEDLIARITRHEGYRWMPYQDTLGNWTIGIGHRLSKAECSNYPSGISYADAEALLDTDIEKVKQNAATEFPWLLGLDDCRQSVIYEMCYQLGVRGVSQFHHMISAVREQDWVTASQQMLNSQWHSETPDRCEELANLMLNGYNEV